MADEGRPSGMEVIHWQDLFSAALDLLEECEREWYIAEVGVRENIQIRLEYLIVALQQVLPFVSINSAQYRMKYWEIFVFCIDSGYDTTH